MSFLTAALTTTLTLAPFIWTTGQPLKPLAAP
jgi:hypothetical protein